MLTRHKQFAENLDGYLHLFDLSVIVDNNRVGKPPRMIALAHQGDVTVFNEEAYEKVKRKAHLNPLAASQEELWQPEPSATAGTQEHAGTFANRVGRSHQQNQPGGNTGAGKEKGPFAAMIEEGLLNQFSPKQR